MAFRLRSGAWPLMVERVSTPSALRRSDRPGGTGRPLVGSPPDTLRALACLAAIRAGRPGGGGRRGRRTPVPQEPGPRLGLGLVPAHRRARLRHQDPCHLNRCGPGDCSFFPLCPGLIRTLTALPALCAGQAGVLTARSCALIVGCGIYTVGHGLHGREVAIAFLVLWAVPPHTVALGWASPTPRRCAPRAPPGRGTPCRRPVGSRPPCSRCSQACPGRAASRPPGPSSPPSCTRRYDGVGACRPDRAPAPLSAPLSARWAGPVTCCGRAGGPATCSTAASRCRGSGSPGWA